MCFGASLPEVSSPARGSATYPANPPKVQKASQRRVQEALSVNAVTLDVARRHGMRLMERDAVHLSSKPEA